MVNWFGFAAVCEQPGCPVKGKTAVATLPSAEGFPPASLIVYWLLAVAAGSPHPDVAYAFARHCCTPAMDKLTTLEGGIGCRLSTWSDPEVNALIPFYADSAPPAPGHAHPPPLPRPPRIEPHHRHGGAGGDLYRRVERGDPAPGAGAGF